MNRCLGVWNSAIQVHPYQLEPVLRALSMPRVSLLLADGVGLGKTIQAGLVEDELLLRRRIRRILIVCPAMLQRQWKYELRRKFNLDFEIIDSDSTFQLRRRMGIDTNPWKAFPRVITSMDYLRMPDVLQQFLQASGVGPDAETDGRTMAHAPWDLLIVDECHHFAPQGGQRASQRTEMLREIRFLFEHRLFLSATPHNGKTVCFTGLLELLDPIRFQMDVQMDEKDKANLAEVRIRRLKDDINKQSLRPPFAEQLDPEEIPVHMSAQESALFGALREYRRRGHAALAAASQSERWVGEFIYSLLTKRLFLARMPSPEHGGGIWRSPKKPRTPRSSTWPVFRRNGPKSRRRAIRKGRSSKRMPLVTPGRGFAAKDVPRRAPGADQQDPGGTGTRPPDRRRRRQTRRTGPEVRLQDRSPVQWIKKNLFVNGKLRDDERLIVFTEYKETLFYLEQRLLQEGFDKNTLRLLYGGMDLDDFEAVKSEFEEHTAAVRLLLATDAASEGINMQQECRWVVHYDIPWSPSRIQQRNGRVSRYGQWRDVSVFYFRCDQEEDLAFLLKVAKKVEQVRQDLGSVERVFSAAIQRHFRGSQLRSNRSSHSSNSRLRPATRASNSDNPPLRRSPTRIGRAKELLESTETRLGISSRALIDILRAAVAVEGQAHWRRSPASRASTASSPRPVGKGLPDRRSP